MALCSHLAFWTGRNAEKIDSLFRQSGLMKEKWDRRQSGTTYGTLTIQRAIAQCSEVYTHRKKYDFKKIEPPKSGANSQVTSEATSAFPTIVPLTPEWTELPRFPVQALPAVVGDYVSAVAENSQTSPDMAAVIGLGVLAVCLQGKFKVEGIPGYYEPLSLYTVVIAAPGERKSSVMRSMTKYLYDYEKDFNEARSQEVRKNQQERESLERQISGLKKKLENKNDREKELELQQLETQLVEMPELKKCVSLRMIVPAKR